MQNVLIFSILSLSYLAKLTNYKLSVISQKELQKSVLWLHNRTRFQWYSSPKRHDYSRYGFSLAPAFVSFSSHCIPDSGVQVKILIFEVCTNPLDSCWQTLVLYSRAGICDLLVYRSTSLLLTFTKFSICLKPGVHVLSSGFNVILWPQHRKVIARPQ